MVTKLDTQRCVFSNGGDRDLNVTLGYEAISWIEEHFTMSNGHKVQLTDRQKDFLKGFYAYEFSDDTQDYERCTRGGFVGNEGISSNLNFYAALCLFELLGECRFGGVDTRLPGNAIPTHPDRTDVVIYNDCEAIKETIFDKLLAFLETSPKLYERHGLLRTDDKTLRCPRGSIVVRELLPCLKYTWSIPPWNPIRVTAPSSTFQVVEGVEYWDPERMYCQPLEFIDRLSDNCGDLFDNFIVPISAYGFETYASKVGGFKPWPQP